MKIFFFLLLVISTSIHLHAQNTDPLVKAENGFEKACFEKGIRDGFLAFVDSNGIQFSKDGPVNAKKLWTSLPAFAGIFSWSPSFAEMSLSGDWGYTTGNYEHRPRTLHDTVEDSGQYTTVWHKDLNGEWKYLIDMGNGHAHIPPAKFSTTVQIEKNADTQIPVENAISAQEKKFMEVFEKQVADAYKEYGSGKYILNLEGHLPVTTTESAVFLLAGIPTPLSYHPAGIKISSGNDMAAIYGTIGAGDKSGSYLRIWRHEKYGWKIALEVIKF
jgi:ketosteroid isomerase-like protein